MDGWRTSKLNAIYYGDQLAILKEENELLTARMEFMDVPIFCLKCYHNIRPAKFTSAPHNYHVSHRRVHYASESMAQAEETQALTPVPHLMQSHFPKYQIKLPSLIKISPSSRNISLLLIPLGIHEGLHIT